MTSLAQNWFSCAAFGMYLVSTKNIVFWQRVKTLSKTDQEESELILKCYTYFVTFKNNKEVKD